MVNNIAFFRGRLGDLDAERQTYLDAIEQAAQTLGEDHPVLGQLWENLGDSYKGSNDNDAAAEAYQRAADIRTARLGADHYATAGSNYKLAFVIQARDPHRAAELVKSVVLAYQAHYPPGAWERVLLFWNLGQVLSNIEENSESETAYARAFAEADERTAAESRVRLLSEYIESRFRVHDFGDETAELCRQLEEWTEPSSADACFGRLVCLMRQQRLEDAARLALSGSAPGARLRIAAAQSMIERGDIAGAETILATLSMDDHNFDMTSRQVTVLRCAILLENGDAGRAASLLRDSLEDWPDGQWAMPSIGDALRYLGTAEATLDREDAARIALQRAIEELTVIWGAADWSTVAARVQLEALDA